MKKTNVYFNDRHSQLANTPNGVALRCKRFPEDFWLHDPRSIEAIDCVDFVISTDGKYMNSSTQEILFSAEKEMWNDGSIARRVALVGQKSSSSRGTVVFLTRNAGTAGCYATEQRSLFRLEVDEFKIVPVNDSKDALLWLKRLSEAAIKPPKSVVTCSPLDEYSFDERQLCAVQQACHGIGEKNAKRLLGCHGSLVDLSRCSLQELEAASGNMGVRVHRFFHDTLDESGRKSPKDGKKRASTILFHKPLSQSAQARRRRKLERIKQT